MSLHRIIPMCLIVSLLALLPFLYEEAATAIGIHTLHCIIAGVLILGTLVRLAWIQEDFDFFGLILFVEAVICVVILVEYNNPPILTQVMASILDGYAAVDAIIEQLVRSSSL